MANRERGEVDLLLGDPPETFTLCLDLNAQCLIEAHFSKPDKDVTFYDVFAKLHKMGATGIRAFIWAGLQKHHKGLSLEDVGDLIQKSGGLFSFGDKLQVAVAEAGLATIPDKQDLADLGVNVNAQSPPQARYLGRGARSKSTPVQ